MSFNNAHNESLFIEKYLRPYREHYDIVDNLTTHRQYNVGDVILDDSTPGSICIHEVVKTYRDNSECKCILNHILPFATSQFFFVFWFTNPLTFFQREYETIPLPCRYDCESGDGLLEDDE